MQPLNADRLPVDSPIPTWGVRAAVRTTDVEDNIFEHPPTRSPPKRARRHIQSAALSTVLLANIGGYVAAAPATAAKPLSTSLIEIGNEWIVVADDARSGSLNHAHAEQCAALKARIHLYAQRPLDWDGDDGIPPKPESVEDAIAFLNAFTAGEMLPDAVYSPGDGEVMFQWRNSDSFAEVGFSGDRTLSWCAESTSTKPVFGDEAFDRLEPLANLTAFSAIGTLFKAG